MTFVSYHSISSPTGHCRVPPRWSSIRGRSWFPRRKRREHGIIATLFAYRRVRATTCGAPQAADVFYSSTFDQGLALP